MGRRSGSVPCRADAVRRAADDFGVEVIVCPLDSSSRFGHAASCRVCLKDASLNTQVTAVGADGRGDVCVDFAPSLRRHVDCTAQRVAPGTLRQALESAVAESPRLAGYVFDDQRAIRKHVSVFVNEALVCDRVHLEQALSAGDRVLVIQALTGG